MAIFRRPKEIIIPLVPIIKFIWRMLKRYTGIKMKKLFLLLVLLPSLASAQTTSGVAVEGNSVGDPAYGIYILGKDPATDTFNSVRVDSSGNLVTAATSTVSMVATSTPTVSAVTTYTAGDCIGTKQTLTGVTNSSATLVSLSVNDEGAEAQDMDVLIFKADPSNSTFTDNAACAVADADLASLVGVISLRDHYALSDNGLSVGLTDLPLNGATSFYAVAVARGSGYTYDATDALTFVYGVRID